MPNIVATLDAFTPEGDNAKIAMSFHSPGGLGGYADIFIPLTSLNQAAGQINADLKAAVEAYANSQGFPLGGGEKIIIMGCFG